MHFWIDKRSPQCGFGRSRVAASLHTGGSGLSFGHPPRRSGGHKSSSSSSTAAAGATTSTSNTGIPVHRQQQQQQQQHQQAQYHQQHSSNAATTSNNVQYRSSNYPSGSSNPTSTSNNNNNSNAAAAAAVNQATNRNFVRPNVASSHQQQQQHHHYYNNNRQYQQQQQQQQQQQATTHQSHSAPNSSNNNHSTQALTSPTGSNLNSSLNAAASTASATTATQQQQQHPQRYRHPQFGNMSVRTYQPTSQPHQQQQQQHSTTTTTTTNNLIQNLNTTNQLQQQSLDASLSTLNEHGLQNQSPNQTANLSAELYQSSSPRVVTTFARPLTATTMSPAICDHSNLATNPRTTYTNTTLTNNANQPHHHHNPRQRRAARSIESTDLQFLPLHLKCGIFASLVLAVAFIVGIKVYFDNHGTKFEVGLFWLLTATFVFAFCFVSICKVPRVLFASTTSSRSNSRDQTRDRCSMDDADRGSMVNSIDDVVVSGLQCNYQLQEERQSLNINAQAGPPPYHIAILLPETKAKEDVTTLEESPPPSYDKILI